jgi:hypothetical protein
MLSSLFHAAHRSAAAWSFLAVAPPVHGLNVVGVTVLPRTTHAASTYLAGDVRRGSQ